MSDDEGVMPFQVVQDATLTRRSHRQSGKGALGTWWFGCGEPGNREQPHFRNERVRQIMVGRGECESALKLHQPRKGRHRKCQGQNRDLGNPTVRDRRGASGNVTMGAGLRPRAKVLEQPPDPNVRAPELYPDSCENTP